MPSIVLEWIHYFTFFVLIYMILLNGFYFFFTFLAFFYLRQYMCYSPVSELKHIFQSHFYPPVSLLVPAYNEEGTIEESVQSLLMLHYPLFEIIVINDGSKDGTLDALISRFQLQEYPKYVSLKVPCRPIRNVYISQSHPQLIVVDKENGGKADSLNAGMTISRYPLFCAIDADSILEKECLLKIVRPFMTNQHTIAAGGIVRIANGCAVSYGNVDRVAFPKGHLERFQVLEYLRSYLFGRIGLDALGCNLIISGAFGIFKKDAVVACGGYQTDSIGEDMELVVRLHRIYREKKWPYAIAFVPDPVCWTEAPATLGMWYKQRNRWQRGLMDTMRRHICMLLNPRYGVIGLVAMPYFFFFEMLSPIVEFFGYSVLIITWGFGVLDPTFFLLLLVVMVILGTNLSLTSLCLEEMSFKRYPRLKDVILMLGYAILENFGYRQIYTKTRLLGIIDYFIGKKHWGIMLRKGFK